MTEKAKRKRPEDMTEADREMWVMRKCRLALDVMPDVEGRQRVVQWLAAVMYRPVPAATQAPNARQLNLDDTKDPFA